MPGGGMNKHIAGEKYNPYRFLHLRHKLYLHMLHFRYTLYLHMVINRVQRSSGPIAWG